MWEDPKYEWLGSVFLFAPSLGEFSADCDAHGNPVFSAQALRQLIDRIRAGEDVCRRLGEPWEQLLEEMSREMPQDLPLPVGPHPDDIAEDSPTA